MRIRFLFFWTFYLAFFVFPTDVQARDWEEYKKRHFVIYYNKAPQDFVENVEEAAEQYYDEITRNLGFRRYDNWTWEERAKIYIYNDADDYVASSKAAQWSHGVASPKDKIIRTYPAAHGFFDSTLPHELGHIIFREFIGFKARIPRWFEEGVAMYQEKAKRWGSNTDVLKAMDAGTFIPLDELTHTRLTRKTPTAKVQLFYAESASVVYYLISELGKQRFVRLSRKLQDGDDFEETFSSIYVRFKNFKKLNKAWVYYLKNE